MVQRGPWAVAMLAALVWAVVCVPSGVMGICATQGCNFDDSASEIRCCVDINPLTFRAEPAIVSVPFSRTETRGVRVLVDTGGLALDFVVTENLRCDGFREVLAESSDVSGAGVVVLYDTIARITSSINEGLVMHERGKCGYVTFGRVDVLLSTRWAIIRGWTRLTSSNCIT